MKCIKQTDLSTDYTDAFKRFMQSDFFHTGFPKDAVIFDIETTGFSAKRSMCYLIGILFYEQGTFQLRQYFADDPNTEKEMITEFFVFLQNHSTLLHFNGDRFDIPFLLERAKLLHIDTALTKHIAAMVSLDFYKIVKKCDLFLQLSHHRQPDVEQFLGIARTDMYDGGKLIDVYKHFVVSFDPALEHLLLLHNHDDLLGLLQIIPVLSYALLLSPARQLLPDTYTAYAPVLTDCKQQTATNFEGEIISELLFTCKSTIPFPVTGSLSAAPYYLVLDDTTLRIRVPLFAGERKHFFTDYKNYYYLPDEDTCMHKSVATYVDKNHRKQATAQTCYIRATGTFLPATKDTAGMLFQESYEAKNYFVPFQPDFLKNTDQQQTYVQQILAQLSL